VTDARRGWTDAVPVDHRADVEILHRLSDEHHPIDGIAMVAVEAVAVVVDHPETPVKTHSSEAEHSERRGDLGIDALDVDRVDNGIESRLRRCLRVAENAKHLAVRAGKRIVRGGTEEDVVERIDLRLDSDLFGNIDRRLEAKPHVDAR